MKPHINGAISSISLSVTHILNMMKFLNRSSSSLLLILTCLMVYNKIRKFSLRSNLKDTPMKTCIKCRLEKPLAEFAFKNKSKNIQHSSCKQCHRDYSSQHYCDNKEHYIAKSGKNRKLYYTKNREFVDNFKTNKGCLYCNEKDPVCLDFHHYKGKKEYCISSKIAECSLNTLMLEINKCHVLCANCHRKLHAGQILIPKY